MQKATASTTFAIITSIVSTILFRLLTLLLSMFLIAIMFSPPPKSQRTSLVSADRFMTLDSVFTVTQPEDVKQAGALFAPVSKTKAGSPGSHGYDVTERYRHD